QKVRARPREGARSVKPASPPAVLRRRRAEEPKRPKAPRRTRSAKHAARRRRRLADAGAHSPPASRKQASRDAGGESVHPRSAAKRRAARSYLRIDRRLSPSLPARRRAHLTG